jgi:hypothetical protein
MCIGRREGEIREGEIREGGRGAYSTYVHKGQSSEVF